MDSNWSIEHGMTVRRHGAGAEIVWIHGLGESSTSFDPIAARLEGFAHTLVDLPGYGRSAWPGAPTSLEALADHLVAWLSSSSRASSPAAPPDAQGRASSPAAPPDAQGRASSPAAPPDAQGRAFVVGHSMGGVLATLLAERGAARAIVNIDGNISRGDCNFSGVAAAYSLDEFRAHGFAAMRDTVYRNGVTQPPLRGYHAAMCMASPDVFHGHACDLVAMSLREDLAPRFAALTIPALYVAGVPDGICARSRELLASANARWIGVEPAGHWVYLDQPERFASLLASFAAL